MESPKIVIAGLIFFIYLILKIIVNHTETTDDDHLPLTFIKHAQCFMFSDCAHNKAPIVPHQ